MRRNRGAPQDVVEELREKIGLAFKDLRKAGFICRKSASYEGSAAACMMDDLMEKAIRDNKEPKGTVFYTGEDNVLLNKYGHALISFGGDFQEMHIPNSIDASDLRLNLEGYSGEAVGMVVKFALEKHGLVTAWNGSYYHGIQTWLPRYPPK